MKLKREMLLILVLLITMVGTGTLLLIQGQNSSLQKEGEADITGAPDQPPILIDPGDKPGLVIAKEDLSAKLTERVRDISKLNLSGDLMDIEGKSISLADYQNQKLLIYLKVEKCASCEAYYAILQDWAESYAEELQIIICYPGQVQAEYASDLQAAGIFLIPNASEFIHTYNRGYYSNNLLVDETGQIQYYFNFDPFYWNRLDLLVREFIEKGTIDPKWKRDKIQQGVLVPNLLLESLDGSVRELETYSGKPTVVFFSDQICHYCDQVYPLAHELATSFADQINVLVILNEDRNQASYKLAREYYQKYGLEMPRLYETEFAENAKEIFLQEQQLSDLPVFFSTKRVELKWGVREIPAVLLLDQHLQVQNYLLLQSRRGEGYISAKEYLIDQLRKME